MSRTQTELALALNRRFMTLYNEFRVAGIAMPVYMKMLASHVAALSSFQQDPRLAAEQFIADLVEGIRIGEGKVEGRRKPR